MTAAPPQLAPGIAAGLRRLKLAAMRQLAPELLITAKTQRRAPGELLRTLIDAEITARDASNARTRMKTAAFPVTRTLEEPGRKACSIPGPTLDYLASLEWITARENLCLAGPAPAKATSWPPSASPRSPPGTRSLDNGRQLDETHQPLQDDTANPRWSLGRGNTLVPCSWQMTNVPVLPRLRQPTRPS